MRRPELLFGLRPRHLAKDAYVAPQEAYITSTGSPFYKEIYGANNKNVVILTAPWHVTPDQLRPIARNLAERGFYTAVYTYGDDVLSPDVERTVTDLTEIRDHICGDIKKLQEQDETRKFAVFGASLGTVVGMMVTNNAPEVSKVVLNTTGADIAESVWSWSLDARDGFKQKLVDKNISKEQLVERWASISPVNNLNNLQGKEVLVYLSALDEDIPFTEGLRLVDTLREHNIRTRVRKNLFSDHHQATKINYARAHRYIRFLKKPKREQATHS
jgi:hypothetical protein